MNFTYEQVAAYCEEYLAKNGEITHPYDMRQHFGITRDEYHQYVDEYYVKWLNEYTRKQFEQKV